MKKALSRILVLILAMSLVMGLFAVTVFAEETAGTGEMVDVIADAEETAENEWLGSGQDNGEAISPEIIQPEGEDSENEFVSTVQLNSTFQNFINDSRWCNGASWASRSPIISNYSCSGCCAYCADFTKYCYGRDNPASGSVFYNASEIRAGDVINVGGPYVHWFVVLERDGNRLYTAEGNFNYCCVRVSWNAYSINGNTLNGINYPIYRGYHYQDTQTGILDVNWVIDGNEIWGSQSACTVDVYLNGALVANDVDDYCETGIPSGTTYLVTDIKPKSGYYYTGTSTSYSGTISSGTTTIWIYVDTAILGSEMTKGYDRVLPDGDYIIACTCDLQFYLDIVGMDVPAANDSNVELTGKVIRYSTSFPACDVWTITYNNGFYTIKQKNSNVSLDVAGASKNEGANVQAYEYHGGTNQQWAISKNGVNGYRIQARCSGFSLDYPDVTTVTNVRQWSNNNGQGQGWTFIQYMCSSAVPDVEATFNDVKYGDWFAGNVAFAYSRGIMTGMGGTKNFAPSKPLQREQLAAILYRLEGSPSVSYKSKFPDVPSGQWFTSPIIWAYNNGIITGYQNGRFGVGDSITREQFAAMLYRYAVKKGLDTSSVASLSKFKDSGLVSGWAYEAMQWAVGTGIISGKDNGTRIDPYGNAARCECAAMIQRFMVRYGL